MHQNLRVRLGLSCLSAQGGVWLHPTVAGPGARGSGREGGGRVRLDHDRPLAGFGVQVPPPGSTAGWGPTLDQMQQSP